MVKRDAHVYPDGSLKLYVTAADFALTTLEAEAGEAVSGAHVRRIGLTPPWENPRAWRRLIREVLKDTPVSSPRIRRRLSAA